MTARPAPASTSDGRPGGRGRRARPGHGPGAARRRAPRRPGAAGDGPEPERADAGRGVRGPRPAIHQASSATAASPRGDQGTGHPVQCQRERPARRAPTARRARPARRCGHSASSRGQARPAADVQARGRRQVLEARPERSPAPRTRSRRGRPACARSPARPRRRSMCTSLPPSTVSSRTAGDTSRSGWMPADRAVHRCLVTAGPGRRRSAVTAVEADVGRGAGRSRSPSSRRSTAITLPPPGSGWARTSRCAWPSSRTCAASKPTRRPDGVCTTSLGTALTPTPFDAVPVSVAEVRAATGTPRTGSAGARPAPTSDQVPLRVPGPQQPPRPGRIHRDELRRRPRLAHPLPRPERAGASPATPSRPSPAPGPCRRRAAAARRG